MSGHFLPVEWAAVGAELMMVLLGLAIAVFMPSADRWSKRFFIVYFAILLFYGLWVALDETVRVRQESKSLLGLIYCSETVLGSVLIAMLTVLLVHSSGQEWRQSWLFRAVAGLVGVIIVLACFSPFTDWFYSVSPENRFVRGAGYPVYVGLTLAVLLMNLVCTFRWRTRMKKSYFYAFLIGLIPLTAAVLIHFFTSVFLLLGFGMTVCAFSMFSILLVDQIDQTLRQQREIAHQRASIMVLQMRPHFIYNTMMSIYYLCRQNPDLAQRVTLDFTTYLRKNFTAIASEEMIPFSEELQHTRAYLAVEQAQFEDALLIEYDTPHEEFRLPPLTLQPIVENAVKHGLDPDSEPLRITVRTRRTLLGSEILVEDDGAGFETPEDGEPHIALQNIQQRLQIMCGGKMEIMPRQGGGTTVRVTIPRQRRPR